MTYHSFGVGPDMDAFVPADHCGYYQTPVPDSAQANGMHMVDPRLQDQSRPPQMERFLMESNKTLFNPPRTQAARDMAFYPSRPGPDFIAHLPPGSVGRHGSPFSQQYSPASSGAHSPPTDSDLCHDGTQGPSTPPDVGVMSPYMAHISYDYMESSSSMQFPLTGLATNDQCVNLSDINPVSNLSLDQHDRMETPIDFTVDSVFTLPSNSSSAYDSAMFMQPVLSQHAGPESVQHVKEEAGVHDCSAHSVPEYPDPDEMEENLKVEDDVHLAHRHETNRAPASRTDNAPRRSRRPSTASPKLTKSKSFKPTSQKSKAKMISVTAGAIKLCSHCSLGFKDETALQKHTRTQHTRPFTCVFHYAGCSSTFATKNEWKRHVVSQHLALTYWLCKADSCAKTTGPSTQQRSASLPTHGAIFNRKDLYTQHVRRMHAPPHARKAIKNKKPVVDWDESLRIMQDGAKQDRCHLPVYMRCPADGCENEFRGATAWDDRMEHVARHLERAAAGEENPVCFGGYHDPTLTEWAEMHGVDVVRRTHRGWELSNPLRGEGGSRRISAEIVCEEDAEGEDC